jgi:peptide/nickel transport system permease protein
MIVSMRIARQALFLVVTLALGGFFGCLLLRFGPGFDMDERDLDPRYSRATVAEIHKARSGKSNIVSFYLHYLANAVHGDLGVSSSLQQPVGELIADRAPSTFRLIALGLLAAWIPGLLLGLAATLRPNGALSLLSELVTGLFLCFPAAVLALILYLAGGPAPLAIAAAIFPRVYRQSLTLLSESLTLPCVIGAAARGIPKGRILARYVIPPTIPPMAALLGISVTLAFGAVIPVEVVCDIPGLGQLAWKAALSRDLPLLATMTLVVTGLTLAANTAAGSAKHR